MKPHIILNPIYSHSNNLGISHRRAQFSSIVVYAPTSNLSIIERVARLRFGMWADRGCVFSSLWWTSGWRLSHCLHLLKFFAEFVGSSSHFLCSVLRHSSFSGRVHVRPRTHKFTGCFFTRRSNNHTTCHFCCILLRWFGLTHTLLMLIQRFMLIFSWDLYSCQMSCSSPPLG